MLSALVIFGVARLELTAPTAVDDIAVADIEITAAINVDKITFFITNPPRMYIYLAFLLFKSHNTNRSASDDNQTSDN